MLGTFRDRLGAYRAHIVRVSSGGVAEAIGEALARTNSVKVVVPADLPQGWLPETSDGTELAITREQRALSTTELDGFDAAICGCALAIADTGTVVLDGGTHNGRRALSLVPDHLIIVIDAEQVVAGVPDAIRRLDPLDPQMSISGPSAASDIELMRAEGVHGPRRLDVVVVAGDGAQVSSEVHWRHLAPHRRPMRRPPLSRRPCARSIG